MQRPWLLEVAKTRLSVCTGLGLLSADPGSALTCFGDR